MSEQIIIAISREFGSGGQEIARKLACHFHIPLYEKNILQLAGLDWNDEVESFYTRADAAQIFGSKKLRALTRTNEELFCAIEFQFLTDQAAAGKSFVVLGHCAESILKENPNLFTVFVSADKSFKLERIQKEHLISRKEAEKMMKRHNKKRKSYHNQYCSHSWGDSRYYDICIHSSLLGIDETAEVLKRIINTKMEQKISAKARADEEQSE